MGSFCGRNGCSIGARERDDSASAPKELHILNCRLRVCLQTWQNRGAKLIVYRLVVERALRYRAPMGALLLALRHTDLLAGAERSERRRNIAQLNGASSDAVKRPEYRPTGSRMEI